MAFSGVLGSTEEDFFTKRQSRKTVRRNINQIAAHAQKRVTGPLNKMTLILLSLFFSIIQCKMLFEKHIRPFLPLPTHPLLHKGIYRCILPCDRISRNLQTFVIIFSLPLHPPSSPGRYSWKIRVVV